MGWDCHSFADVQSQRSRGLPGFLPGASDPDHGLRIVPSNPEDQAWQRGPPPPGNLPPGLEYLSQVLLSISTKFFPFKMNTNLVSFLPVKTKNFSK